MIKTGWQGFPRFHVAFVIKRLMYIEFSVFRKKKGGGGGWGLEVQEMPRPSYCMFTS